MNRRIVLLNVALVALVGALGWALRANWLEAQAREHAVLRRRVPPKAVLAPPSYPGVQPPAPAEYIDVANKMLFSKDRNPTVMVEPPKPAPEPVMPALPNYSGQMSIGEPVIFLNVGRDVQHSYHAGDKIGDFKLVSFDEDKIVFEWNGKNVERKLEELRPRQILAQAATGAAGDAGAGPAAGQVNVPLMPRPSIPTPGFPRPRANSSLSAPAAPAATAAPAPASTPTPGNAVTSLGGSAAGTKTSDGSAANDTVDDAMFGPPMNGGLRGCVSADPSPTGTVHAGYRKVQSISIFGASCVWEPMK
jgi:hypothetical protein